jgi:hypothetical protein
MTLLSTENTSYGQKKGRESNCQFDSQPLKVKNHLGSLVCRSCATYHWKSLDKGYNFALDLTTIRGLHTKLWDSKITRILIQEFRNFHLKVPWQNDIWVMVLWPSTKYTIRGGGGGFPQVRVVVNLVNLCLPVARLVHAPKVLQLCINQLVVWFVQVWIIELFVNLPSPHPEVPTHSFTSKVLWVKEHAPTPSPSIVFTFGLIVSPSRCLGVRHIHTHCPWSKRSLLNNC